MKKQSTHTTIRLSKATLEKLKEHIGKTSYDEGIDRMLDALGRK